MEVSKVPKIGNWQYFCDILKSGSYHPNKICFVCFNESPLNVIKKTLFHLESYFRSQDILIFVLTFCRVQRNLENLEKIAFFEKLRESLENSEKIWHYKLLLFNCYFDNQNLYNSLIVLMYFCYLTRFHAKQSIFFNTCDSNIDYNLLCFHDTGIILCMALYEQALVWLIRANIICLFSFVISSVSYII